MDTFLVKAVNGDDDYEAEFKFLETSYGKDVDTGALPGHATKYCLQPSPSDSAGALRQILSI